MGFSRSFTREQIISGLLSANTERFTDNDGKIDGTELDGYVRSITAVLDTLDLVASKLGDVNDSVSLGTLQGERFSQAVSCGRDCFSYCTGEILAIGSHGRHGSYFLEFGNAVERTVCRTPDRSPGTEYIKYVCEDGNARRRPFTLCDLLQCTRAGNFDLASLSMKDAGLVLPDDIPNPLLVHELLDEAGRYGFTLPLDIRTVMRKDNRTRYDLVSQRGRIKDVPKSVNRYPLAVGYMIRHAASVCGKDACARLEGENARRAMERLSSQTGWIVRWSQDTCCGINDVLDRYLGVCLYPGTDGHTSELYIRLCRKTGHRADAAMRSEERMTDAVYDMTGRCIGDRKLGIAKPFRNLARRIGPQYRLLETAGELEREGQRQDNCVASYAGDIGSGECAVFTHTDDRGRHYTVEVKQEDGRFYCSQFLGRRNRPAPEKEKAFDVLLEKINRADTAKRRKKPVPTLTGSGDIGTIGQGSVFLGDRNTFEFG